MAAGADEAARKLFPQITDGIYNDAGKLVMNCKIAADGLTVSDAAWNDYAAPSGQGKRWSFNQTPPSETPLIGYTFDASLAGLQVTVTEELFMRDNPWKVVESYQEILQLGGKPEHRARLATRNRRRDGHATWICLSTSSRRFSMI